MPVDPSLVTGLLELVQLASAGALTIHEFARRLLELAARTGIAPALLSEYLTEAGVRFAEEAADIAEEAKLAAKRLK